MAGSSNDGGRIMATNTYTHTAHNSLALARMREFAANCDSFGRDHERIANKRTSVKVFFSGACSFLLLSTFFGCCFGNKHTQTMQKLM